MTQSVAVLGLIVALFVGFILAFYRAEKRFRAGRIRKQLQADPLVRSIKVPEWLIELYEATFRFDR